MRGANVYLCDQHHLQQQEHAGPAQGAVQPPGVERVKMRHLRINEGALNVNIYLSWTRTFILLWGPYYSLGSVFYGYRTKYIQFCAILGMQLDT